MTQRWHCLEPGLRGVVAAAAALAVAWIAPAPVRAAISAGTPIQVPWLTRVNFSQATSVAILDDGSFAIAGLEIFLDSGAELKVQFFRPDGAPQTFPTVLFRPPAVVDSGGIGSVGDRYFLVWKNDKRTYARFYSQQGMPLGAPIRWPYSDIPFFIDYYRFGNAPLWRILLNTYRVTGHDQDNDPIYSSFVQVANADGVRLGLPVELPVVDAAINGSGRFVVVEASCFGCTQGIQVFDSMVRPLTPLVTAGVPQLEEPGGVSNSLPLVAFNAQGQTLLVWLTHPEDTLAGSLVARLYAATGQPASAVVQLRPVAFDSTLVLEPIALDDGAFLLCWVEQSPTTLLSTAFVTRFDPGTMSIEEPAVLAEGRLTNMVLAVSGAGKGVFTWQTLSSFGDVGNAYLRTLRVTH